MARGRQLVAFFPSTTTCFWLTCILVPVTQGRLGYLDIDVFNAAIEDESLACDLRWYDTTSQTGLQHTNAAAAADDDDDDAWPYLGPLILMGHVQLLGC